MPAELLIRSVLNGTFYSVPYDVDVPTVGAIHEQIAPLITEGRRNHIIRLLRRPHGAAENAEFQTIGLHDTVAADDELAVIGEVECRMKPDECALVEDTLLRFLSRPTFEAVREGVIAADALVAGGSICAAFGGFGVNDLDIYVHYSRALELLRHLSIVGFMCQNDGKNSGMHLASEYDQSFFRKNHILVRFALMYHRALSIDVMVIPDEVPLTDVVTNFDLSFCEVWWDGRAVFASDPEGIRRKEGVLKPDYRAALFTDFNPFIIKRLQKYRRRGYTIHTGGLHHAQQEPSTDVLGPLPKHSTTENGITTTTKKRICNMESWAVKTVLLHLYRELSTFVEETIWLTDEHHPFTGNHRLFEFYFLVYPGVEEPTYADLVERFGKPFVDLFAAFTDTILVCNFPSTYDSIYRGVFLSIRRVQTDDPCRYARQVLMDLPREYARLLEKGLPHGFEELEKADSKEIACRRMQDMRFENDMYSWDKTLDMLDFTEDKPLSVAFYEGCHCGACRALRTHFSAKLRDLADMIHSDEFHPCPTCEDVHFVKSAAAAAAAAADEDEAEDDAE